MKKKILYVFGGEKASGAEIVIQRLIDYNLDTVEPHLFVSPGKFADELIATRKPYSIITIDRLRKLNRSHSSAFKFFTEAIKNYFYISLKVVRYIKTNKIDTIHANTVVPASYLIPAIVFSRFFSKSKMWIWSDHDLQYFSKIDNIFSKFCSVLYNKTFVVSDAVKKKYGDKKSIFILYNGLDLNTFKFREADRVLFRNRHHFSDNKIVLIIAATISPRKGQLQLIKVFKQLLLDYSNVILVIAGGFGNDDDYYNDQVAAAIKDNSNIFYPGHVSNMIELYCGSDVVISNSNKAGGEPLGTTICEAMACQKIVIASDTGGTPEIISDKQDGFIFKAENEEALKKTLEYVITNWYTFDKVRALARKKIEEKFCINTMKRNYNSFI